MTLLFIGKYRTFGCCKPAISRVAHTIEKIEALCDAYLVRTDPLPSILETSQFIKEKLMRLLIVVIPRLYAKLASAAKRTEMTTGPAFPLSVSFTHAVLRCGFLSGLSVLALYLPFTIFWVFFFRCLLFCDFIIITRPEARNLWLFARHIRLVLLTRSLSG